VARLPVKTETIKKLFALSGNSCAFPNCKERIIDENGQLIGEICHIEAANINGERYNPSQTDEERRSFDNLILLCANHHLATDNVDEYPVERLKKLKSEHEIKYQQNPYSIPIEFSEGILQKVETYFHSLYELSSDTNIRVQGVQDQLGELTKLLKDQFSGPKIDEEKIHIAQLDSIKELKKQNKHRTVIDLLYQYKKDNWDRISEELKYKVIANIGIAYLDLHEAEIGAQTLFELRDLQYETEDSIAFITFAAAILKKHEEFDVWFEKGKNSKSINSNFWLAFIIRYKEDKPMDEIIEDIPPELLEKPEILFELGKTLFDHGQKKEGAIYLKRVQETLTGPIDNVSDTKAAIASLLIKDVITPFKYIYSHFTTQEALEIQEAHTLFSEAWELIAGTELADSRWYILLNRGVINKVLGKLDKCLQDFQTAYELSKEYVPFKNLLVIYFQLNKFSLAEELLASAKFKDLPDEERFVIETFKARLLSLKGKVEEAIELLKPFLNSLSSQTQLETLNLIISTLLEHNNYGKALPYCQRLQEDFPENINGHLYVGYIEFKQQQTERALHAYNHAYTLINSSVSENEVYLLAKGFIDLHVYDKAAALLETIVETNLNNEISRGLIYSYYQLGNVSKALSLCLPLFQTFPHEPFLAEVLISIYQETNNYGDAINVVEQFLAVADQKVRDTFLIKAATLYYYLRDLDQVKKKVLQIEKPEELPLDDAFKTAQLLAKTNEIDKALEVAYKVRGKFYDQSQAHTLYIGLVTSTDREYAIQMFPEQVKTECAVSLKRNDGAGIEQVFLITNDEDKSEEVLKPTDELTKLLLDKKVGDEVIMEKGFGIVHKFLITQILDKYVYAFRQSLKLFETKFASKDGIKVLRANPGHSDDEIIPFIKGFSLQEQSFGKQAYDFYNQGIATVGVLAAMFKRNAVKQWLNITSANEIFIFSYLHDEGSIIRECASGSQPLVIDLTALVSLFCLLDQYPLLEEFDLPMIVAQSTVDEVQQFYDELDIHGDDGITSMGFQDGRMVVYNMGKDNVLSLRGNMEAILKWCKNNAKITTSSKTLELEREERKKTSNTLGESFHDTILLALEHEAIVLSDDGTFKKLLAGEHKLKSFSTYQLSVYLFEQKKISLEQFNEISYKLILCNYIYIPVSSDLLWKTFEASAFQLTKPFTIAAKGLLILRPLYAGYHLARFLKDVYLNAGLTLTKEQSALYLFAEVSKHNEFDELKRFLKAFIEQEFRLLPTLRADILDLLKRF
jgi:tetratricopeptide (TPR) repeat protein